MKKILAIILALIMTASLCSVFASAELEAEAFTGEGTEASPYLIKNAKNLVYLQKQVAEGNTYAGKLFNQTNDIDLANAEWTPIGTSPKPFSGVYDGCGYAINNFSMTQNPGIVGLFGFICATADCEAGVANLTINGKVKIDGIKDAIAIGSVAGWCYKDATDGFKQIYMINLTSNVDFEIKNVTNQPRFGAVVGYAFCTTLENCVNNGNIVYTGSAVSRVGGIAGQSNRSVFRNCVNNGKISIELSNGNATAAGICPIVTYKVDNVYTEFVNCINNGEIKATTKGNSACYVAGIASNPYSSGAKYFFKIDSCANTANIYSATASTTYYAYNGGIMGYGNKSEWYVTNCVNTGVITNEGGKDARNGGIVSVCSTADGDASVAFANNTSVVPAFAYSAHDKGTYTDDTPAATAQVLVDAIKAKITESQIKINGFDTTPKAQVIPETPVTADNAVYFAVVAAVVAVLGTAVLKRREN